MDEKRGHVDVLTTAVARQLAARGHSIELTREPGASPVLTGTCKGCGETLRLDLFNGLPNQMAELQRCAAAVKVEAPPLPGHTWYGYSAHPDHLRASRLARMARDAA